MRTSPSAIDDGHPGRARWSRSSRPDPANPEAVLGAKAVFTRRQRWMLLMAFALLVMLRLPYAWVEGRFLDEEATVFFAYAWHHAWLDALFRPFAGYWNLGASATTVLAVALVKHGVVPLERAPFLTMSMALAVQLLPAVLILTGRARWLSNRLAVMASLLIIATAPATEEVFFNVLHIQFHLALCAALILAFDVPRRPVVRAAYAVLLVAAPLCGPGAIVILPLFGLRGLIERDPGRLAQLAAFAAGATVQLLLFYGPSPMRGHLFGPGAIAAAMFVRLIVLPIFNSGNANSVGAAITQSQAAGGSGWWWAVAAAFLLFGALTVMAARRRDAAIWLVLSALSIAVASFGFGMVITYPGSLFIVGHGERYNFLPLVLLGLALVVLAARSPGGGIYAPICLLVVLGGAIRYPFPLPDFGRGPSWSAEVAAWRRDHHHPLAVWPGMWAADLSDETRACTPAGHDLTRSTDPRYCESGWAAGFYRRAGRR